MFWDLVVFSNSFLPAAPAWSLCIPFLYLLTLALYYRYFPCISCSFCIYSNNSPVDQIYYALIASLFFTSSPCRSPIAVYICSPPVVPLTFFTSFLYYPLVVPLTTMFPHLCGDALKAHGQWQKACPWCALEVHSFGSGQILFAWMAAEPAGGWLSLRLNLNPAFHVPINAVGTASFQSYNKMAGRWPYLTEL